MSNNILKVSSELFEALTATATTEAFESGQCLFTADDDNAGVFLVLRGKVCLRVNGTEHLDRTFGGKSLLGLPSTFTGKKYSLSAIVVSDAEVAHVSRDRFMSLMTSTPEFCRETTDILCRETSFINAALAQRRRHALAAG